MKIDIVGSFLPPEQLIEARNQLDAGNLSAEQYSEYEDRAIAQLVEQQLNHGLDTVTDGELRRRFWDTDFYFGLAGVSCERLDTGRVYQEVETHSDLVRFTGQVAFNPEHPFFKHFAYLQQCVDGRAECRQTLPSPADLYLDLFIDTDGDPQKLYPFGDLKADLARAWRETLLHLYELGCRNAMLDDSALGRLSEQALADELIQRGYDVGALTQALIELNNASVADLPADFRTGIYLSSGTNVTPRWLDSADRVMEQALAELTVDYFILPFYRRHTQDLEVLRAVPPTKTISLGLVNAHTPFGENDTETLAAMHAAEAIVAPERLRLTTRTGFKLSSYIAHGLSEPDQWRKLTHLLTLAARL